MKQLIILVAALLLVQNWDKVDRMTNPPPAFLAQHEGKVVLYATDWCGYCAKTREMFKAENIDYLEYDIEKSVEGRQQYDALEGAGVPVLLIDGSVIHGYQPKRILQLANDI